MWVVWVFLFALVFVLVLVSAQCGVVCLVYLFDRVLEAGGGISTLGKFVGVCVCLLCVRVCVCVCAGGYVRANEFIGA